MSTYIEQVHCEQETKEGLLDAFTLLLHYELTVARNSKIRKKTGPVGAIPIMFPEQRSQNLMKVGSNNAYGSQTVEIMDFF